VSQKKVEKPVGMGGIVDSNKGVDKGKGVFNLRFSNFLLPFPNSLEGVFCGTSYVLAGPLVVVFVGGQS